MPKRTRRGGMFGIRNPNKQTPIIYAIITSIGKIRDIRGTQTRIGPDQPPR
jgi:hypothetical protein